MDGTLKIQKPGRTTPPDAEPVLRLKIAAHEKRPGA